ncbi:hypothetical protein GTO10_05240 [Candidatus Saccharibacteria bacterium]|nr:hypothetical protein [Candidatus Saccharibacteria bacterium]
MKLLAKLKTIPLHPFLFAIFPVLFFFQSNIGEVLLGVVFKPSIFFLFLTALGLLVFRFLFKSWPKAAVFMSIGLWQFFIHGRFHEFLGELSLNVGGFTLGTDDTIFLIWLVLDVTILVLLLKIKRDLAATTGFLNVTATVLVATAVFTIASYEFRVERPIFSTPFGEFQTVGEVSQENPDIYYLIFDGYASNEILEEFYNYDNSYFTGFLEESGFYVAYRSRTNYPKTPLSLASSLNFEYLNEQWDSLTEGLPEGSNDETFIYPLIEDNEVVRLLGEKGYRYYHLGSWFEGTKTNRNADSNFNLLSVKFEGGLYLPGLLDGFFLRLLETTSLSPILRKLFPQTDFLNFNAQHKALILYQFEKLKEVSQLRGPKFVFAHILAPHRPFVFTKDCEQLPDDQAEVVTVENYIGQLECTNQHIIQTVDYILVNSSRPKVIVIQADEGIRSPYSSEKQDFLEERFGIINAFYPAAVLQDSLYPSITPVNVFRIVFNSFFGEGLEILPDRNFLFDHYHYNLTEVTDSF